MEKVENTLATIKVFLLFAFIFVLIAAGMSINFSSQTRYVILSIGIIAALATTLAAVHGLKTINKFRKGRDVDISYQEEKNDEKSSDES